MEKRNDLSLFAGSSSRQLAEAICKKQGWSLGNAELRPFSDGEIYFQILENVRGRDVFVVQSTCNPVNDSLIELLLMIDAFKRASARRITAVMPYYGYARQDRKDKPRVSISAKVVADILTTSGAHRILTMDLHAAQIQGFFNLPVDHLFAAPVLLSYIARMKLKNITIVSPDAGGVERARAYAKRLKADLAIMDKRRKNSNVAEVMNVIGDVKNRNVVIVDDMIDTAGTLVETVKALDAYGARRIFAAATHAVLSGPALRRIQDTEKLERIIVTNTIPLSSSRRSNKIKVLSVATLLGKAIRSIHEETSVSSLFV